jgi:hypothetical protein
VDEQRDGPIGGARQGLRFYARCAREAWRRSWDAANAWPPIVALLVLYGGARLGGLELSVPGESGAAIGTGLFIAVAWLSVFLVQFVAAPPRLCARLDAELLAMARRRAAVAAPMAALPAAAPVALPPKAEAAVGVLPTPPSRVTAPPPPMTGEELLPGPPVAVRPRDTLEVRLHDQRAETDAVDAAGERLPPSRAYVARVTNRSDARVRRCQLFFGSPTHIQVVSGPFDLAPGAHRDLPVLRVIDEVEEPHALLYFLDGESWAVAGGQAAWLPEPGRFKVKVMAANAPEAALDVTLACSAGTPLAWTLVEADSGTAPAPKAGRKRRRWAADAVAEPSSGD